MVDKAAPDQNGDDEMDDTLRADLEAALAGATEAVETVETPEAATTPEAAEPPAGPARGADGKFVSPAAATPPAQPTQQPTQPPAEQQPAPVQATEQQPAADRPPPGWSVQSKADYAALPAHVRADIAKREAEISAGFRQYSEKLKGYEGFDEVMRQPAPGGLSWADRLKASGETPVAAIGRLLAAQAALETNPRGAIDWLARSYGVDLKAPAQAAQPVMGADGKPAPQHLQTLLQGMIQQAVAPHLQKIQTFEQGWQQRQQQEQAAREAALVSEIEAFASDPKNIYFENVQPLMVRLINSGAAKDLAEAYQMAVYAHPETRQRLISEQQAQALRTQQAQQQRVVSDARRAAGSITGAPGNPAIAGDPGSPPDDLRGALEQAWSLHAGRA